MKVELKFSVPRDLSEIKLEQYQRYINVAEKVDVEDEGASDFVNLKALEIFCGLELKESYKIPINTFESLLVQISECLSEQTPLIKRFWFRGSNGNEVEFGMVPDLQNISFGEYVDLEGYIKDWKTMHKAMAVLFRPIVFSHNDNYKIEDYEGSDKYADYMLHMPANVALGAVVFFYRLGMKLSSRLIASSLRQVNKDQYSKVESRFLERNGVGISQFMHSLEEMSQNLTRLQDYHYLNA